MVIEIPDSLVATGKSLPLETVQLETAFWLYQRKLVTLARAARWLGMTRLQFQKLLAERGIPIHYSREDLKMDFENA